MKPRERDPLAVLQAYVKSYPTQKAAAKALGISGPHLTDLLRRRRGFTVAMLGKLGLTLMVIEARSEGQA